MNKKRPVNLDLTTIKFPLTAITSIMHRISGVALFFGVPILLYGLQYSLSKEMHFHHIQKLLMQPSYKWAYWLLLVTLIYHLFAGLRHITMDMGFGESLAAARKSSVALLILVAVSALILGYWLW